MSFCILRNAWFFSGFMLMRQITEALVLKWLLSPTTTGSGICFAGFFGEDISRAVFSLVCTPVMLGIMVGLDQKDSYALFPAVACTRLVLLRFSVLPVFSAILGSTVAGGESFSPDDAYDSAWNSFKPMKGKYIINYFQYQDTMTLLQHRRHLPRQLQLFPVQVDGQVSQ